MKVGGVYWVAGDGSLGGTGNNEPAARWSGNLEAYGYETGSFFG
jgi:hypothetical protein